MNNTYPGSTFIPVMCAFPGTVKVWKQCPHCNGMGVFNRDYRSCDSQSYLFNNSGPLVICGNCNGTGSYFEIAYLDQLPHGAYEANDANLPVGKYYGRKENTCQLMKM